MLQPNRWTRCGLDQSRPPFGDAWPDGDVSMAERRRFCHGTCRDLSVLARDRHHPYTRAMFAAAPRLSDPAHTRPVTISGSAPMLNGGAPGCSFAARCTLADDHCRTVAPCSLRSILPLLAWRRRTDRNVLAGAAETTLVPIAGGHRTRNSRAVVCRQLCWDDLRPASPIGGSVGRHHCSHLTHRVPRPGDALPSP